MRQLKIPLRLIALATLCAACPAARAQHAAVGPGAAQPSAQFRPAENTTPAEGVAPGGSPQGDQHGGQQGGSQGVDSTPPGMVAFFMTEACPAGWLAPASAQGRLIFGVNDAAAVGLTVNPAMGSMAPPAHRHGYSTKVNLNRKNIALANGSNKQGAKKGDYTVGGTTKASDPNLPFIQLTVCQKQ